MGAKRVRPRTCVGCGKEKDKRELVRVARSPRGHVAVDITGKAPGRGAYICPDRECLLRAKKKKGLEKALRTEITPEVYSQLEDALILESSRMKEEAGHTEILSIIGLAKKADLLVIGFDKIKQTLSKGDQLLVILSSEHSENVRRTLRFHEARNKCRVIVMEGCCREKLSRALGSHNVQAVAIDLDSGMSRKILQHVTQGGDAIE